MKLLTQKVIDQLIAGDSEEARESSAPKPIAVKFFDPCGSATWYITGGTPITRDGDIEEDPSKAHDWHLFGLCDLYGDGGELGYVMFSDLTRYKSSMGVGIERDRSFEGRLDFKKVIEGSVLENIKRVADSMPTYKAIGLRNKRQIRRELRELARHDHRTTGVLSAWMDEILEKAQENAVHGDDYEHRLEASETASGNYEYINIDLEWRAAQ